MTSQSGGDDKVVEEIVYKLKSQGLFDQLRKECLNDVDTKPAYQNLRQRVEGYVSRFLSKQTWSPDLNKNQLRDSLRRQINQSGMLSSGVERIIEQVVNPKIFTIIKPKIDEIVCKHLGIDPDDRQKQLEERKLRQQQLQQQQIQQHQQQQQQHDPQPLMSLNTSPGQAGGYDGNVYAAYSPSANWHRPFGTMLNPHLNPNYHVSPPYSQGYGPYSMTSPMYPYMQQSWGAASYPGLTPSMYPGQILPIPPGSTTESPSGPGPGSVPMTTPPPIGRGTPDTVIPMTPLFTEPPPPLPAEPMESIPAPPPEPAPSLSPPGISPVTLPPSSKSDTKIVHDRKLDASKKSDASKSVEGKKDKDKSKSEKKSSADGTYNILKDIPLPIPLPGSSNSGFHLGKDLKKKGSGGNGNKLKGNDDAKDAGKEAAVSKDAKEVSNGAEKHGDVARKSKPDGNQKAVTSASKSAPPKPLTGVKDSKDETNRVNKQPSTEDSVSVRDDDRPDSANINDGVVMKGDLSKENVELQDAHHSKQYTFSWTRERDADEVSSLSVSSVHTSDLSSFEDDGANVLNSESELETVDDRELVTARSEETTGTVSTGESADVSGSQSESQPEAASPVKVAPVRVPPETVRPPPAPMEVTVATTPKPRKLVSLMYNYSDSEEEETREDRKARIARDKEDRYAKRQQRRAELEAKKKEREEEKARLKEEKKRKQLESGQKSLSEGESATASTSTDELQQEESPEEKITTAVPASPKKKTKQELKDQLREQKVMEKKLALRRQRTRTRRYTSEEFTSIFTEKQQPFSSQSYTAVEEQIVEIATEEFEIPLPPEPPVDETPTKKVEEEEASVKSPAESPVGSPGSADSPATPTQDEPVDYPVIEDAVSLSTGIPVYEITPTSTPTTLTLGQVIHETRSRTRKLSDERKSNETHSTGRPGSPFSDISEASKSESVGEPQERRSKRRKMEEVSPIAGESTQKETRGRKSSTVNPTECAKGMIEGTEVRTRGKRYSLDDLYKPRTSHRRCLSPPPSPITEPSSRVTPPSTAAASADRPTRGSGADRLYNTQRYDTSELYKPRPSFLSTSVRRRFSPTSDRSVSPPPSGSGRSLRPPSHTPPLSTADNTTKRYDADDLYKPRQPSARSSRYLQRRESSPSARDTKDKPSPKGRELGTKGDNSASSKRDLPFAAKELSDEESPDESRETSPDRERKRHRKPIELVDFGEAARRMMGQGRMTGPPDRPPDGFRGRSWGNDRHRFEHKPGRKFFEGGRAMSDVEKTGSRSPGSNHSSGSGSHYSTGPRRDAAWGEPYDSEPGLPHRVDSRSPSKVMRASDVPDLARNRSRSPTDNLPYEVQHRSLSPTWKPPSPRLCRPPSPSSRRPPSPLPSSSPLIRRPPSPPIPRPPSPPTRRPPSPGLGPRTRRQHPPSPEPIPRGRRPPNPSSGMAAATRTSRRAPYHPNMRGVGGVGRGRGWTNRLMPTSSPPMRYLRSRSPAAEKQAMPKGREGKRPRPPSPQHPAMRGVRGRRDPSPPPTKRPRR